MQRVRKFLRSLPLGALLWLLGASLALAFINGVDTTVFPPVPVNSLLVEVPSGSGGEVTAIVWPYNGGTPAAAADELGGTGDGNLANNIDDCAGGKFAVRWDPAGGGGGGAERQWGSTTCNIAGAPEQTGADGNFAQASQTTTATNATPNGELESVIVTEMTGGGSAPMRVRQKTIIRNNAQWFATVYYIINEDGSNWTDGITNGGTGVVFYQGADLNICGSFNGDNSAWNAANDTVYGFKAAPPGGCANPYAGFSGGPGTSLAHNCRGGGTGYSDNWADIRGNTLLNGINCNGDAAVALRWNIGALNAGGGGLGQIASHPVIWGIGGSQAAMQANIDAGLAVRYDTGTASIDTPATATSFLMGDNISVSATAALYGLVDVLLRMPAVNAGNGLPVTLTTPGAPGGCSFTNTQNVELEIPATETAAVNFLPWNTAACPTGNYTIQVCAGDPRETLPATTANDCQSIMIEIRDFILSPDTATQQVPPASSAAYDPVTATLAPTAVPTSRTVEFDVGASSEGWGSQLWDSTGTTLLAEDTDGDGVWDFIIDCTSSPTFCDSNMSGDPDTTVTIATPVNVIFQKVVPALAGAGKTDTTTLTAIPSSGLPDTSTFTTTTPPPPVQTKTLHLHPGLGMDTFPDTSADNTSTAIPAYSSAWWQQTLPFQTDFTLAAGNNVDVTLYIGTNGGNRNARVTLFATNGISSISIGQITQTVNQANNPATASVFSIPVTNDITIPAGYQLALGVTNLSNSNNFSVWHDNNPTPSSRIDMQTTTYIRIADEGVYTAAYPGGVKQYAFDPTGTGPGAWLRATIEDPFGSQDIGGGPMMLDEAVITATDPMGNFLTVPNDPPGCETTGTCVPMNQYPMPAAVAMTGAAKIYEWPLALQSKMPGTYYVCIQGNESNGVQTSCSFNFVINSATAIKLVSFTADGYEDAVHVSWTTAQEIGTFGYNIYRSEYPDHGFVQVNSDLILGLGYSDLGGTYVFVDQAVVSDRVYYYLLEEVEFSGTRTNHGPVAAMTEPGSIAPAVSLDYVNQTIFGGEFPPKWSEDPGSSSGGDSGSLSIARQNNVIDLVIDIPPAQWGTINISGSDYDTLSMTGYGKLSSAGAPEVPSRSFLLDIPSGNDFSWELMDVTTTDVTGKTIAPAAAPALPAGLLNEAQNFDTGTATPVADPAIYGSAELYPGTWTSVEKGPALLDSDSLLVSIYPAQTSPLLQTVSVASQLHLRVTLTPLPATSGGSATSQEAQWALASAGVLKVLVSEKGMQHLSGANLAAAGFDAVPPADNLQLYHHGKEIPLAVNDGGDGILDPADWIEFYGEPASTEFTRTAVYWLQVGTEPGLRPIVLDATPALATPVPAGTSHLTRSQSGEEKFYFSTLNAPGEPHWFHDAVFAATGTQANKTLTINTTGLVSQTGDKAILGYELRGGTTNEGVYPDHHIRIELNGNPADEIHFEGRQRIVRRVSVPVEWVIDGANTVKLTAIADAGINDSIWIRNAEIFYPRDFSVVDDTLRFEPEIAGAYTLTGFTSNAPRLYDVADPEGLSRFENFSVTDAGGSFDVTLGLPEESEPENRAILAITDISVKAPVLQLDPPSDLANPANGADYIIISHESLLSSLSPLVQLRENQGMRVFVTDVQDVYDEFSYGEPTPDAIRDFLRYAADNWVPPAPRYALLAGDASYDPLDRLVALNGTAPGQSMVPAAFYDNQFFRTGSDNAMALLDNDLLPDVSIGRIPAQNTADLDAVITKILTYENTPMGEPFASRVLMVSDNAVGSVKRDFDFLFPRFVADDLEPIVEQQGLTPETLLMQDAVSGVVPGIPELRAGILQALNDGVLLAAYAGHGAALAWADELVFRTSNPLLPPGPSNPDDIAGLSNSSKLAVMTVLDCLNAYYVNPFAPSLGEEMLLRPASGVAAFWGPSGLTPPNIQHSMAAALYRTMLEEGTVRLGDAARNAFAAVASDPGLADVVNTWVLLGDPALRLRINHPPQAKVADIGTSAVNETIMLDGSESSDPNDDSLTYKWDIVELPLGSTPIIQSPESALSGLTLNHVGTYKVRLTVTDQFGASASRDLTVTASSSGGANGGGCVMGDDSSDSPGLVLLMFLVLWFVFSSNAGLRRLQERD